MIEKLKGLWYTFLAEYEDFMWKYGEERRLLAKGRLAAHEKAMAEGKNSPYTHPEEYDEFF